MLVTVQWSRTANDKKLDTYQVLHQLGASRRLAESHQQSELLHFGGSHVVVLQE